MADLRQDGKCDHGFQAAPVEISVVGTSGWVQDYATGCDLCSGAPASLPYKPGANPEAPKPARLLMEIVRIASLIVAQLGEEEHPETCCACPCHQKNTQGA